MSDLILESLTSVNESIDDESLDSQTLTDLKNAVLDEKIGRITKRGGIVRYNSNNAGGGIYSLHDVKDGSGNNYILGVVDTTLKISVNGSGSWSDLKTGLTSNQRTKIAPMVDKFVISNGTEAPFITDLTTVWNLEITKPDISNITSAHKSGGDLPANKIIQYRLVYVASDGAWSEPSQPFTHIIDTSSNNSTDGTNRTLRFDTLPVSSDSRISARLLFRSYDENEAYYFHSRMDNETTYFVDEFADEDILDYAQPLIWIDLPSTAKFVTVHKDKIWLSNGTNTPKNPIAPAHTKVAGSPPSGYTNGVAFIGSGTSGGSMTESSTYIYRAYFVSNESLFSDYITFTITLGVGETRVLLNSLPAPLSEKVTFYLYRTKADGSTFYLVPDLPFSFVKGGASGYYDGTADSSLGAEFEGNPTNTRSCGIWYSEETKPSMFVYDSFLNIYPDDNDEITGKFDQADGLLVFKTNSICKIYTTGGATNVVKLFEEFGCDNENTIAQDRNYFYFTYNSKVYRYPDKLNIPLSDSRPDWFDNVTFHGAVFLTDKNWYILTATKSSLRYIYVYDVKLNSWYIYTTSDNWYRLVEKKYGDDKGKLLLSNDDNGYLKYYDETSKVDYSESTEANAEISVTIKSKTYTYGDTLNLTRLRIFFANYKKRDGQTATFKIIDKQTEVYKSYDDTSNAANSTDYKTIKIITDNMDGSLLRTNKTYFEITGSGIDEFNSVKLKHRLLSRSRIV